MDRGHVLHLHRTYRFYRETIQDLNDERDLEIPDAVLTCWFRLYQLKNADVGFYGLEDLQRLTPDDLSWTDWRDNLRSSLITQQTQLAYHEYRSIKDWMLCGAWPIENERTLIRWTREMRRVHTDEELLVFAQEHLRRVVYTFMEQHLASQWYRARAAAAEFRSNFAMLEAMHEDSEEDFVWSGKNRRELRRMRSTESLQGVASGLANLQVEDLIE